MHCCPFLLPYGVEVCTAFLHLRRHPGRHQNALLILAAPRHKSASGKTDPKNAERKHKSSYYLWSAQIWQGDHCRRRYNVFKLFGPRNYLNQPKNSKRKLNMRRALVEVRCRGLCCRCRAAVGLGGEGAHGRTQGELLFLGGGCGVRAGCSTNVF